MTDFALWPCAVLRPAQVMADPVPFSRNGGTTLGGLQRSTRTDRGYWSIGYRQVSLQTAARRRMWNMMRAELSGMASFVAVPVWSYDTSPRALGAGGATRCIHSDGALFSDGSRYSQPTIRVQMAAAAAIGDTSISLRKVYGIDELAGVRFSYEHALYETAFPTSVVDDVWTMPVFPAVRAAIPADAWLEFDLPTCMCRLAADREMDASFSIGNGDAPDVNFVEAAEYWNDLALA